MASARLLKEIRQNDKDLLSGFIRKYVSDKIHIPDGIMQLCLIYYLIFEQWDADNKGDLIQIVERYKAICQCKYIYEYQTILGTQICKTGLHHWTLKLLQYDSKEEEHGANWNNIVGIVGTDQIKNGANLNDYLTYSGTYDSTFFFVGWVVSMNSGIIYKKDTQDPCQKYGEAFKTKNGTIDINLDLNKGTLGFVINGTDYGVAYDNIDPDGEYKLFITLNKEGTAFEIVSYHCE